MERKEFDNLFRDLMQHIFDYAALENHPLADLIVRPDGVRSKGEALQKVVFTAIDQLQPVARKYSPGAIEWRPFLILHKRYVEGMGLAELSSDLALSDRQIRRDHSRALQALASRLWELLCTHSMFRQASEQALRDKTATVYSQDASIDLSAQGKSAYHPQVELLDISSVLQGVASIMERRCLEEEIALTILSGSAPVLANTDRVILRQILISLFNYALHLQAGKTIQVSGDTVDNRSMLQLVVEVDESWTFWRTSERTNFLEPVERWCSRLGAILEEVYPANGEAGLAFLRVIFPRPERRVVLVVDDQQPAQRMYQRYLSRLPLQVVGVSDPSQVMSLARSYQPILITLDVMMPHVDGWEILQALQQDPQTRHIPVVICSAWAEPELARSLGAAGFLKKPITQKDLLSEISRLKLLLLGNQAGWSPGQS
jgi:CheY-like chemotaxis protein